MAQLAERFGFNLANPLAGDAKLPADLLERAESTIIQPEAKHDDLALSLGELAQRLANLRLQQLVGGELQRVWHGVVFDEIAEKRVPVLADRSFQGDRMSGDVQDLAHLLIGDIHGTGDLDLGWLSLENLLQSMPGFLDPVDRLADVDRQPDGSALIRDRASDGLANPPGCVG